MLSKNFLPLVCSLKTASFFIINKTIEDERLSSDNNKTRNSSDNILSTAHNNKI